MSHRYNGRGLGHGVLKAVELPAPRKPRPDAQKIVAALSPKELLMRGGSCSVAGRGRLSDSA